MSDSSQSTDALALERGIQLENLESLRPVYDQEFAHFRKDATVETWTLTALWDEYHGTLTASLPFYAWSGDSDGVTEDFDNWRQKQMIRTAFDVGAAARGLTHPPVAFELSDGCSVGCWFCGISAKKFGGHFPLDAVGVEHWREILEATQSVIGRGMVAGFCYWATEPLDHPDYVKFLETYYQVTGVIPQTTTAIPLRNEELTRNVLSLWDKSKFVPNRFSVLTTPILRRIHNIFTPEELLGVELVLQGFESLTPKSNAGKAYENGENKRPVKSKSDNMQEGTIACVTGFLVNLPNSTVRLVSPTLPSKEWPDGYYVFSSAKFKDPSDLAQKMREMAFAESRKMLSSKTPISLSSSYRFENEGEAIKLRNDIFGFTMDIFSIIGPMLDSGKYSPNEILKKAVADGYDPILVMKIMSDLTNSGFVGDVLRPASASVEELV
ncbi:radical SAM family RiPP maturation amino acid epimerase [Temperatibacter marinus]|uniref:radical SAM family RiPP maturation amino acid epimerase n=1 Tax=Temperatibacter marinus TaxID=1456591 RepID=UPI0035C788F8